MRYEQNTHKDNVLRFKYYKKKNPRRAKRVGIIFDVLPSSPVLVGTTVLLWKWYFYLGVMFDENGVSKRKDS